MQLGRSSCLKLLPVMMGSRWAAAASVPQTSQSAGRPSGQFDPFDYGAAGDGRHNDTKAVQAAIDAAAGGGRVYLHNGSFLCGSLRLKSNVALHLETGAVLLGSARPEDYPDEPQAYPSRSSTVYTRRSLIFAEKSENLAIFGNGAIDGQGQTA